MTRRGFLRGLLASSAVGLVAPRQLSVEGWEGWEGFSSTFEWDPGAIGTRWREIMRVASVELLPRRHYVESA